MPELPDITAYLDALAPRLLGRVLERIKIANVFVLRTAMPPIDSLPARRVGALRRIIKRNVFGFEGNRRLVLHRLIAGRVQGADAREKPARRNAIASVVFEHGTLTLTQAKVKRRASPLRRIEAAPFRSDWLKGRATENDSCV